MSVRELLKGWACQYSPEQKERTLHQERSPAIQVAHPPRDGLCVSRLEVRCPHPRPEAAGVQSKCLRLVDGDTWYQSNRQIHEDLGVPLFAGHVRSLTASFDSKLADSGNPRFRQLCRYADRGFTPSIDAKAESGGGQQASRGLC
jgi:hypothetical protein